MGAGAASDIVGLIVFAVESIIMINKVLSTLKDGKDELVASVSKDVGYLQDVLEHCKTCCDTSMLDLVKNCQTDLKNMAEKLRKLEIGAGDKLGGKLLKAFKAIVSNSELKTFQEKVVRYSAHFTPRLSLIIQAELFEKHNVIVQKMEDLSDTGDKNHRFLVQKVESMSGKGDDNHKVISEKIEGLSHKEDDNHRIIVMQLSAEMGGIREKLDLVNYNVESQSMKIEEIRETLSSQVEPNDGALTRLDLAPEPISKEILNTCTFDHFFPTNRIHLKSPRPAKATRPVITRLKQWSRPDIQPCTLWLKGPCDAARDLDNDMTIISAKIIDMAKQAKIPIISYFSQPTQSQEATRSLLYALLGQAFDLLPSQIETSFDFSEYRFRRISGSQPSWEEALSVLRDLLEIIPKPIFCVLDAFQWVDNAHNERKVEELLKVLREGRLRILFVTSDTPFLLQKMIILEDVVRVEARQGIKEDIGRHGIFET